jgi:hypothetical protein
VAIDPAERFEPGVQDHRHITRDVIDDGENRHRPGRHAQMLHQLIRAAERETPAAADDLVQALEIDHGILDRSDEEELSLLVLQEQVLGVRAGNGPAQFLRLIDGEQGRMADCFMGDAKRIQGGKQRFGSVGHGGRSGWAGCLCSGRYRTHAFQRRISSVSSGSGVAGRVMSMAA